MFSARGFGLAGGRLPPASAGKAGSQTANAGFGDAVVGGSRAGSDFPTPRGPRGAAFAGSALCAAASCCLRRLISASFAASAARSFSMSASVAACFALSPETAADAFSGGENAAATRGFGTASRLGDRRGARALPDNRGTISARYVRRASRPRWATAG